MSDFQSRNRLQMAVDILHNVCDPDMIDGVVTATTNTTTLTDAYGLYKGGTNEYKGRQVVIYDATGAIVDGEKSWVASSASAVATCSPAFTGNITTGDKYAMIPPPYTLEAVYNSISQQISKVSSKAYKDKITETTYTEWDRHEYAALSSFTHLHSVEYVYSIESYEEISSGLWTGATSVTASSDTELYRQHTCTKLAVGGAVAAAAQLGYIASSIADYSNYDTLELWIRSDIAQTAANLELLLCSDTLGVTAVDTMSLPALTIDTWTRIQLTLANPELDTAIRSIALKQKAATDIGACNIWLEYPISLKASSRHFTKLSSQRWQVINKTTPVLKIDPSIVGNDVLLRLSGYQLISLLSDNTTNADIDPGYIVAGSTADLLINNASANDRDVKLQRASAFRAEADRLGRRMTTSFAPNTVKI